MTIEAAAIKQAAGQLGADLCGIAPVSRFSEAPAGFHPRDIFAGCESVIVVGARFPRSTLEAGSQAPYTLVRNVMVGKLDAIAFDLADRLEQEGVVAVPVPSADPYDHWDAERRHGRGILSLKHAAVLAGLGVMGRNTLLLNDRFGNMLWLGAVLVSAGLPGDPPAAYRGCPQGCTLCLDACPQQALDGRSIDQKRCRERSISVTEGGGWMLSCNTCRKACPLRTGIKPGRRASPRQPRSGSSAD